MGGPERDTTGGRGGGAQLPPPQLLVRICVPFQDLIDDQRESMPVAIAESLAAGYKLSS